jgi:hypothetical protein
MSPSSPTDLHLAGNSMTVEQWRDLLRGYSRDYLNSAFLRNADKERLPYLVSDVQRQTQWMGRKPATEDAVRALEGRLDRRLPPSYRNFLLVSDGWGLMASQNQLYSAGELGWFADVLPDIWDGWTGPGMDGVLEPDEFHIIERSLLLGESGDGVFWLLSASKIKDDGEWPAYKWHAGDDGDLEPYDNFAALVIGARRQDAD